MQNIPSHNLACMIKLQWNPDFSWSIKGLLCKAPANNHNMATQHIATLLRAFGHTIAMCCNMLGVVGSNLTIFKHTQQVVAKRTQHIAPDNVALTNVAII